MKSGEFKGGHSFFEKMKGNEDEPDSDEDIDNYIQ